MLILQMMYKRNSDSSGSHMQARVNVPGLSERTLERDVVESGISLGAEVQVMCYTLYMYMYTYHTCNVSYRFAICTLP